VINQNNSNKLNNRTVPIRISANGIKQR